MIHRGLAILLAVVVCTTSTIVNADLVTVLYHSTEVEVNNVDGYAIEFVNSATFANGTISAAAGSSHSTTDFSWSTSPGQTIFNYDITQSRGGDGDAYSYVYHLDFTANEDATYLLSGYYNVTNVGAETGTIQLTAQLWDYTPPLPISTLAYSSQVSLDATNPAFTLGGTAGEVNSNVGSLFGNLVAGHTYYFQQIARTSAINPNWSATATGNINLTITRAAVPEPSTIAMWSIVGLIGGIIAWRKRRS